MRHQRKLCPCNSPKLALARTVIGMSQNPEGHDQWREILESMLGPEGAEEAMRAISASGMDFSELPAEINPAQLQAAMAQMQQMLSTSSDPDSQWKFASDVARQVAHTGGDPTVTAADGEKVRSVLTVADLWMDTATYFDPAGGPSKAQARVQWAEAALPALRSMSEPVADQVSDALVSTLSDQFETSPALGGMDITSMMGNLGRLGFAMQVGQAAGTLAREVFGGSDIGVPLLPLNRVLVPANIREFAKDLDAPEDEVWHFLAVRETAHARLFEHVPWLRAHVLGAIEQYARGIEIDLEQLESSIHDIDPTDMDQLRSALGGDIFLGSPTDSQRQALTRLETTLALIEGWVEEVTWTAVAPHLPHAVGLREMLRRRRAAGGPAEDTFRTLVGLELRPRRVREAATLWGELTRVKGIEGRDALWGQLDLMPTAEDLDNPARFLGTEPDEENEYEDLDAELAKILDAGLPEIKDDSADSGDSGSAEDDGDSPAN